MAGRILSRLKAFRRDRRGLAALEFAMVGPLLIFILLAMMEMAWLITRMSMLDDAVAQASRQIYIGATPSKSALEQQVCDSSSILGANCRNNINIEVTVISDFNSIPDTEAECRDEGDEEFTPTVDYNTGAPSQIVFLRVCVRTDVLTPGLAYWFQLPATNGGRYDMVSTAAFMNEP